MINFTPEAAYREGYRAGYNGHGMLAGIQSYPDSDWCVAWVNGYKEGCAAYRAQSLSK